MNKLLYNQIILTIFATENRHNLSTKEKLIKRFKNQPTDFTFDELMRLFTILGYEPHNKGATSGSRVGLVHVEKKLSYTIHKPHPDRFIKGYVMRQLFQYLTENNLIK